MPPYVDEGPGSEDLERFGDDVDVMAYCPECGAEVYDDVVQCPACRQFIEGRARRSPPVTAAWQQRTTLLTVVLIVLGLLFAAGLAWLLP